MAEKLKKENEELKSEDKDENKYKEAYEQLYKLFNEIKDKYIKLQNEIEEMKKEKLEKSKNYKIEGSSLDYLRPFDYSDTQKKYDSVENIMNIPKIKFNNE